MFVSKRIFLVMAGFAAISVYFLEGFEARADNTVLPVSVDSEKIAIQGYDTVAYFTDGKAVKGSSAFESEWMGSRWQFANAEHRDMFTENPDAYAPRFGGYCVMAMVNGEIFRANPLAWVIIDGKLYLNSAPGDAVAFQRRSAEYIQKAEETWKAVNQ